MSLNIQYECKHICLCTVTISLMLYSKGSLVVINLLIYFMEVIKYSDNYVLVLKTAATFVDQITIIPHWIMLELGWLFKSFRNHGGQLLCSINLARRVSTASEHHMMLFLMYPDNTLLLTPEPLHASPILCSVRQQSVTDIGIKRDTNISLIVIAPHLKSC